MPDANETDGDAFDLANTSDEVRIGGAGAVAVDLDQAGAHLVEVIGWSRAVRVARDGGIVAAAAARNGGPNRGGADAWRRRAR